MTVNIWLLLEILASHIPGVADITLDIYRSLFFFNIYNECLLFVYLVTLSDWIFYLFLFIYLACTILLYVFAFCKHKYWNRPIMYVNVNSILIYDMLQPIWLWMLRTLKRIAVFKKKKKKHMNIRVYRQRKHLTMVSLGNLCWEQKDTKTRTISFIT